MKIKQKHICPVCYRYEFNELNSYLICPYCAWEDDLYMENHPDDDNGDNELSLNEYRKKYQDSNTIHIIK